MLTHLNEKGLSKMVDVGEKNITKRRAVASGKILMKSETIKLLQGNKISKGNVLNTAQVAGIMALKETSRLIPMCHGINVEGCDIDFEVNSDHINVICNSVVTAKTGIEMEVLTGVSVALLTIYDMCKAVDKDMVITDISLLEKTGGKSNINKKSL